MENTYSIKLVLSIYFRDCIMLLVLKEFLKERKTAYYLPRICLREKLTLLLILV